MTPNKRALYAIPEFIVLPPKLRKYALFTLVDGRTHSAACTLLRLNPDRVKNDPRIQRLRDALTPVASAGKSVEVVAPERCSGNDDIAMFECVRRIARDLGDATTPENPAFAKMTFVYPEGHVTHAWLLEHGLSTRLVPDSEATHATR